MREQRDNMMKLMEKLREEDVFMSFRPDLLFHGENIVVTFRKTGKSAMPYHKSHIFSFEVMRAMNIDMEDLLIDMVDSFIKEFKEKEEI